MKVVFLDRDGTMGGDGGGKSPKNFPLFKGAIPAIRLLNKNGFRVLMVTNQSRIARGYFTESEFVEETDRMIQELETKGAYIKDYFFCPHMENQCNCRKPKTGMIEKACLKYPNIDLQKSYLIGDNGEADMALADKVGVNKILVKTGWGQSSLTTHRHLWCNITPNYVAKDILEATEWIVNKER